MVRLFSKALARHRGGLDAEVRALEIFRLDEAGVALAVGPRRGARVRQAGRRPQARVGTVTTVPPRRTQIII